jgi:hypothetical protein
LELRGAPLRLMRRKPLSLCRRYLRNEGSTSSSISILRSPYFADVLYSLRTKKNLFVLCLTRKLPSRFRSSVRAL